jgi:hypothetical protein
VADEFNKNRDCIIIIINYTRMCMHETYYLQINTRNTYNPLIIKIESEKSLWKQQQQEENDVTTILVRVILQLKRRRDQSRYAVQSRNYVRTFFDFLITFGYVAMVIEGKRQYGDITAAMFAQFTTTITRTASDGLIYVG